MGKTKKALGPCADCGAMLENPWQTRCKACAKTHDKARAAERAKERRAERLAAGRCQSCNAPLVGSGSNNQCTRCLASRSVDKQRYLERRGRAPRYRQQEAKQWRPPPPPPPDPLSGCDWRSGASNDGCLQLRRCNTCDKRQYRRRPSGEYGFGEWKKGEPRG